MTRNISLGLIVLLFLTIDPSFARQVTRVEVEPNDLITDAGPHNCNFQHWGILTQITGSISPQDTDIWCASEPPIPIQDGYFAYLEITCDQEMSWFDETAYQGFPGCPNLQSVLSVSPAQGGGAMSNFAEWILDGSLYFCFSIQSTTHTGPYSCEVSGQVLPVELTFFSVVSQDKMILFNWETQSETNNSGFEIQTSRDGSWTTLAFVEGKGTTIEQQNYNYTLTGFDYGSHKFRLKQIDFDGGFSLSDEVELDFLPEDGFYLSELYPNPFSISSTLDLHVPIKQSIEVKLVNGLGQVVDVLFKGVVDEARTLKLEIEPDADLPTGRYFIHVQGEFFSETKSAFLMR